MDTSPEYGLWSKGGCFVMSDRSSSLLLLILLMGMVLRLGLMAPRLTAMDDPDNYLPMARSVAVGKGAGH